MTCTAFWTLFTPPTGSAPSAPATPTRRAASRPRTARRPRREARKRRAGALTRWQNHLIGLRLRAGRVGGTTLHHSSDTKRAAPRLRREGSSGVAAGESAVL